MTTAWKPGVLVAVHRRVRAGTPPPPRGGRWGLDTKVPSVSGGPKATESSAPSRRPGSVPPRLEPLLPGHRGSGRDGRRPQGGSSPRLRLGLALLQAGRIRRLHPPAGGGGGLFLPPSRQPGRQEVSARPARCGEPGSWEQPQLDWRPPGVGAGGEGLGRRGVRRADPRPRVPPLFPAALASRPRSPLILIPPAPPGGGLAVPHLCAGALGAHGLSGPGREGGGTLLRAVGTPGSQRSEGWEGETAPRRPRLPPPLFTRRLPPRKLNPPAVILFGNFGQLP